MLTPDDIAQRRFLITLRGYDRDEVANFLQEVGDEVRGLRRRLAELEAQVARDADATTPGAGDVRAALQVLGQETTRVLVAAEDSAREIESRAAVAAQEHRDEAAREARETVEQANRQAARVIAEAERRRDAVADEIAALKQERDRFLEGLRASMASIGGVVGGLSGDDDEPAAPHAEDATADVVEEPAPVEDDEPATLEAEEPAPVEVDEPALAEVDEPAPVEVEDPVPAPPRAPVEPAADVTTEIPVGDPMAAGDADVDEPSEPVEADEPTPSVDEPPLDQGDEGEQDAGPDRQTVRDRRDAALQDLRDDMGRQCKRGLQEIQNEVLASIRDHGRGASLDDLLPTESELDGLGGRATEHLTGAYQRARADAAAEVDAEVPADEEAGDVRVKEAMTRFRAVLGHEITSALRATLRAGLEAEEPSPQLSERVGEAFRDLRGPVVETAVEEHLQRTYAHGLVDAWRQLGVTQVQWQAVDEPRCPEGRCRTNAAEGTMQIGEEFPSGDAVPPAHQGCACVVVPVVDEVA